MIKDIVDAGGVGFLIPAVLLGLLVMVAKGVFGLFGRKSRTRKEFLEHWSDSRIGDDLWLEVAVRHQFGIYLPAFIIRLALSQPHKAKALLEISDIWRFLRLDARSSKVAWERPHHGSRNGRARAHRLLQVSYFGVAFLACVVGWWASQQPVNSLSAWVGGILALQCVAMALLCSDREGALKTAIEHGDVWVERINAAGSPTHTQAVEDAQPVPAPA